MTIGFPSPKAFEEVSPAAGTFPAFLTFAWLLSIPLGTPLEKVPVTGVVAILVIK